MVVLLLFTQRWEEAGKSPMTEVRSGWGHGFGGKLVGGGAEGGEGGSEGLEGVGEDGAAVGVCGGGG